MHRHYDNARYLEQLSIQEQQNLLLEGFAFQSFTNLQIEPRRDITKELKSTYDELSPEQQQHFRLAVYQAIVEATPPAYETFVLEELIFLAVFIELYEVADYLTLLLQVSSPLRNLEPITRRRTESVIRSVLQNLAIR